MSVSVLEALQNAELNFKQVNKLPMLASLAQEQLHNAIVLLEKGYSINAEVEPLLNEYGSVENVPDID